VVHPLLRRVCCCHPYCITRYCPGCVAATLIAFTSQGVLLPPLLHYTLLSRVCRCHPYYINFARCVAATRTALHIITNVLLPPLLHSLCRVCCCHPYYSHVAGRVAATLYYARVHPTTFLPSTAKQLCSSVVFILHAFLSDKVINNNLIIISIALPIAH